MAGSRLPAPAPGSLVQSVRGFKSFLKKPIIKIDNPGFPRQPDWFSSIRDFPNIVTGLQKVGFSQDEIAGIMGENWLRFYDQNFGPVGPS